MQQSGSQLQAGSSKRGGDTHTDGWAAAGRCTTPWPGTQRLLLVCGLTRLLQTGGQCAHPVTVWAVLRPASSCCLLSQLLLLHLHLHLLLLRSPMSAMKSATRIMSIQVAALDRL